MANRNVSQLPENTDPQDTDWLLGASGNSPTVLQKMAVGNLSGSAPSAGGSIKFALPINQNHTLTSSGYYFTDNIASDIEINCSNLGIGEHIYWQNLSTKAIVFSGLNSIDSVSIPANKGVKISSTNFIQFFLKDANKNIKKLSGNHLIDWLPGQAPPNPIFTYASNGDTNGLIYWVGTNKNTTGFSPSNITSNFTVSAINSISGFTPNLAVDRGGSASVWMSNTGIIGNWWQIDFGQEKALQLNNLSILSSSSAYTLTRQFNIQGSNDNSTWTTIGVNSTEMPNDTWRNIAISNTTFWRYIRLSITVANTFGFREIEFYGEYLDN